MQASALRGPVPKPQARYFTAGQIAALVAALVAASVLLGAGTMMVPVKAALLPAAFRGRYIDVAIAGASLVVVAVSTYVYSVRRWGRRFEVADEATTDTVNASRASTRSHWFDPLSLLQPEVVPTRLIVVTAVVALGMVAGAWVMVLPPWAVVSAAIIPWIPMFFAEGLRKYKHYGLYAFFAAITLLQIGHLGEHTVQVAQMFIFNGDLSRAHGVFGALDFETVHFVWDGIVWIGLGVLVVRFGARNPWLWISLATASLHEIEHIYLFTIYRVDPTYYSDGGFEGIMGFGGLVGSPLWRPYLHFAYNVTVIVPLLIAFWLQTKQVYRSTGSRSTARTPAAAPA